MFHLVLQILKGSCSSFPSSYADSLASKVLLVTSNQLYTHPGGAVWLCFTVATSAASTVIKVLGSAVAGVAEVP